MRKHAAAALLLLAATLAALAAPPALAHNYAAPYCYLSGVYASEEERNYPPASDEEMAWLLKMMQDDDKSIRAVAAGALGQTKHPRAVEPLIKALSDRAQSVRWNAAMAAAHFEDPRIAEAIGKMPKEEGYGDPGLDPSLAAQGDAGIDKLIAEAEAAHAAHGKHELGDSDREVAEAVQAGLRERAVDWAIDKTKSANPKYVGIALTILTWTAYGGQSKRLEEALNDQAFVQGLMNALKDPRELVVDGAASLLILSKDQSVGDRLVSLAADPSTPEGRTVRAKLKVSADPAAKALFARVQQAPKRELDDATISRLVSEVAKAGKYYGDYSRGSDETEKTRRKGYDAAEALADDGSHALTALMGIVKGKDTGAAHIALSGIIDSRNIAAVDALVAALPNLDKSLRNDANASLLRFEDPRLLRHYLSLLGSDDEETVGEAISALAGLGDASAIKPLAAMLAKPAHRFHALHVLARFKDPEGVKIVAQALKGKDIDMEEGGAMLSEVLSSHGAAAVDALLPRADDPDPLVRAGVVRVIAASKDLRAASLLTKALGDKTADVRREAALAAAQQPDASQAEQLAGLLADKDRLTRESAGVALAVLGDKRGADAVMRVLKPKPDYDEESFLLRQLILPAIHGAGVLKDNRAVGRILMTLGSDVSMSTFERVTEEQHKAARETRLAALRSITGQDFGHAYYRWIAWWFAQGNDLDLGPMFP